jgi:hypothetical protein
VPRPYEPHDSVASVRSGVALTVDGPMASNVENVIRSRFDDVLARSGTHTELIVPNADQAAIRALLTLLWDSGHEVLSMTTLPATAGTSDRRR